MSTEFDPVQAFSREFSSFEGFSKILRGYNLDFIQLDRGRFRSALRQIQCGRVFINHIRTTRRLEVEGNPPPGIRTFGIPTVACMPFYWRNQFSDGNTIQVYKPTTEVAVVSHPFFEAIDVSIDEAELNSMATSLEYPDLDTIVGKREMIACEPHKLNKLRSLLQFICREAENPPHRLTGRRALQTMVRTEVPTLLLQALISSKPTRKTMGATSKNRTLQLAVEHFHQLPYDNCSLDHFCIETGINKRSLQRAFRDRYGISPMAYAKALGLNKVYKVLKNSDPKTTTIANVAADCGFWHMSQFGQDYRHHFGELPSQTLHSR